MQISAFLRDRAEWYDLVRPNDSCVFAPTERIHCSHACSEIALVLMRPAGRTMILSSVPELHAQRLCLHMRTPCLLTLEQVALISSRWAPSQKSPPSENKAKYIAGLISLLTDFCDKGHGRHMTHIATQVVAYRARFLNDFSRIVTQIPETTRSSLASPP